MVLLQRTRAALAPWLASKLWQRARRGACGCRRAAPPAYRQRYSLCAPPGAMSAKGRSFRRRSSPDEGDDGDDGSGVVAPAAQAPAPRAAPRAARPAVALSFGGDEDEDAPALKPKKRLGAAAPAIAPRPAAALAPASGAYSRESLAEVRPSRGKAAC